MNEKDLLFTIETLCVEHGKLQAIIESSINGIIEIDNKGLILSANPAFCELFDLKDFSKKSYNIMQILNLEEIFNEIESLFHSKKEFFVNEFTIKNKGSFEKFITLKLISIPVKEHVYVIGIIHDKTSILSALKNREYFIRRLYKLVKELKVDNRETIYILARLVEIRDRSTGKHLERVEAYTRHLGLKYKEAFSNRDSRLTEEFVDDMALSSVLHDIGKVGISDSILLKPGKLSKMEFEIIKQHTTIVAEALKSYQGKKDYLAMGREIASCHHEKWDGTGYPKGLKGDKIPLSARIVSLCDVYDALVNDRPYKEAYSHSFAVSIILEERGKDFDPDIVDLFEKIHLDFKAIHEKYKGFKE